LSIIYQNFLNFIGWKGDWEVFGVNFSPLRRSRWRRCGKLSFFAEYRRMRRPGSGVFTSRGATHVVAIAVRVVDDDHGNAGAAEIQRPAEDLLPVIDGNAQKVSQILDFLPIVAPEAAVVQDLG
jgi:hypothetical protein